MWTYNPEQLDSNENCPEAPFSTNPICGDACNVAPLFMLPEIEIVVNEMGRLMLPQDAFDLNNDPLDYEIDSDLFEDINNRFDWVPGPESSGQYDFIMNTTDGVFEAEKNIHVTVLNRCTEYDEERDCWVGCNCRRGRTKLFLSDMPRGLPDVL